MGTEQRKRMGAESSHLGMSLSAGDVIRRHLREAHGFTRSDFENFGNPDDLPAHLLGGAHQQEHAFNLAVDHGH